MSGYMNWLHSVKYQTTRTTFIMWKYIMWYSLKIQRDCLLDKWEGNKHVHLEVDATVEIPKCFFFLERH